MADPSDAEDTNPPRSNPYKHLPEPVELADTIATKETDPPPDPQLGRDTEREFMLRHGGFP
ncbi:MAG: hypothetical protein ACRDO8_13950 [Nocardioidaceae bacterium]